jgi:hypothetical protein
MIANDDIAKMTQVFATKQDLKALGERFVTNERFDQAMGKLDLIIEEIKTVRQEQSAHYLQHEDIDRDLTAIKNISIIAHELKKQNNS